MVAAAKVVVRDNLDLTKGFKIDEVGKKIQVNADGDTLVYKAGALAVNNAIVENAGKGITAVQLTQGGGATKLVFTKADGSNIETDVSLLAKDVNVTSATFDPETTVLTLTEDEGGPTVTVNLGDLAKSKVAETATVTLSGDGSTGAELSATVRVSAEAGNKLVAKADGLYVTASTPSELAGDGLKVSGTKIALDKATVFDVELQDAFGTRIGFASSTNA